MATEGTKRKLSAVFSTDVKEYSRLMSQDERGTIRTLTAFKETMSGLIEQYKGRVVDSPGDNLLAEFGSAVDAVNCAVEVQRDLAERNAELPPARRMEFRIGINVGDIVEEEGRIYGDGVNIAARMESLAEGGGICISGTAHDQVNNKIGLEYEFLGVKSVKNIPEPVRVYRVLSFPGAAAHRVVEAKSKLKVRRRRAILITAAATVCVAAALVWYFLIRPSSPSIEPASEEKMAFPLPDKPSIAVLPFANMTGDSNKEYLCDGISDQIITGLSMVPRLFVIARNSSFTYKGRAVKVQQVAEELGVRYVLEGGVQESDGRLRITIQLVDAIQGHHIWSERYDKELKDAFALQDEITKEVMTALQVKLTEGDYAADISGSTTNLKANECFWYAEKHFFKNTKEDNAVAREWAEKALELDPEFSGAWALLGYTHLWTARFGWSDSPALAVKQAGECAKRALAVNNAATKAWILTGDIYLIAGNFDGALASMEKAVSLSPNDPLMIERLATALYSIGRYEESISLFRKAMRICPYYSAYFLQGFSFANFLAGRYEEALAVSKALLDRCEKGEITCKFAHGSLVIAYAELGMEKEARKHANELLSLDPKWTIASFGKKIPLKIQSDKERTLNALRKVGLPE